MAVNTVTIGVIGGNTIDENTWQEAYNVGAGIAARGAYLVCGGLGGVMEAASRGASEAGGTVIGILPSADKRSANQFVSVVIPTGLGLARNTLVVQASDVLIAFPGSYGTLSEIGFALNVGKTVIRMPGAWNLPRIGKVEAALFKEATDATHAVGLALNQARL